MRSGIGFLGAVLLCGCVTQRAQVTAQQPQQLTCGPQADSPALALACDPAVLAGQPALYLDRDARRPGAFAGYDQPTVTYSYLRIDDHYNPDQQGKYDREAITERTGVSTR